MRFEHDTTNNLIRRLPRVTTEGWENPAIPGQLSSIYRIISPIALDNTVTPKIDVLSNYVGLQINTAEYGNLDAINNDFVYNHAVYEYLFGNNPALIAGRDNHMIHDIKSNGSYIYILWSCSEVATNQLLLTRISNNYIIQQTVVVATNDNTRPWVETSIGAAQSGGEFIPKTCCLFTDIDDNYVFVAFIQRKEVNPLEYSPNFGGGDNLFHGLMVWHGGAANLAVNGTVDIQQPATNIDVTEVSGYSSVSAPTDTGELCWIQYDTSAGSMPELWYGTFCAETFGVFITGAIKSDFLNNDFVRLPQLLLVGLGAGTESVVSYSWFHAATGAVDIYIRQHLSASADFLQASLTALTYSDAVQYYMLCDSSTNVVMLMFYNIDAGPNYRWYAVRKLWNAGVPLQTQLILDFGANDYGGHIEGCWDDTEGVFILAYPRYTAAVADAYLTNDAHHVAFRDPLVDISDFYENNPDDANGGMERANRYCLDRFNSKLNAAYNYRDIGAADNYIGYAIPGFGGIYCDLSLGDGLYSSFSEVLAVVMGMASSVFGDKEVTYTGIKATVWDEFTSAWIAISDNLSRGSFDPDSVGVGLEHDIPVSYLTPDVGPVTERLTVIITNDDEGTLRDPVHTKVNFLAIQPKDNEPAIIATKTAVVLGVPVVSAPNHGLGFIEYDAYDDTSDQLLLGNSVDIIPIPLDLTAQEIVQPFYIHHEENLEVDYISLFLRRTVAVPTDVLRAKITRLYPGATDIYNVPQGAGCISDIINQNLISLAGGWMGISFPTPIVLHPGTLYGITLYRSVQSALEYVDWFTATTVIDQNVAYLGHYTPSLGVPSYAPIAGSVGMSYRIYGEPYNSMTTEMSRDGGVTWKTAALDRFDNKDMDAGFSGHLPLTKRYLTKAYTDYRTEPTGTNPQMRTSIIGNKMELRTLSLHWR